MQNTLFADPFPEPSKSVFGIAEEVNHKRLMKGENKFSVALVDCSSEFACVLFVI